MKRFQFVNNQWTKSQQDVKFSCTFNPLAYRDSLEYNASESYPNSQFSSKCHTPTDLSRTPTGSMCNLLIQNEGNSCSSTLSRERDLAYGPQDEELLLNSAAKTLAESSNKNTEEQEGNTEQDSAQSKEESEDVKETSPQPTESEDVKETSPQPTESEDIKETSPQPTSEITLEITDGTSSPVANGEMAAEITSAKAISVATLKSPIQYNLFAIAVRCNMAICTYACV